MSTKRASAQSFIALPVRGAILFCLLMLLWELPGPLAAADSPPRLFVPQPAQVQTNLIGFTRARYTMDIVSKESGFCQEVLADIGDELGPGGVFARLETTFIDLDRQRNRQQQAQIEARIAFLTKEAGRYRRLFQNQNIDESTLDRLENDLIQARQDRAVLHTQGLTLAERKKDHTLRAHPGWLVIARHIQPGEWVRSGQTVGRAGDYRTLLVPFALSPEELRALHTQAEKHRLFFPHIGPQGREVPARIEHISPAFDPQTRKTEVHLAVAAKLLQPRGGLRAVLHLLLPDPAGGVLVPASAVLTSYGESLLVRPSGERIPVVILGPGPQNTQRVSSEHIQAGDRFQTDPG